MARTMPWSSYVSIFIWLLLVNFSTCHDLPEPVTGLAYGYYKTSCPRAEEIIFEEMKSFLNSNISSVGGFIRVPYHDCFVQGCDASVLVNATDGELSGGPNLSLRPEVLAEIEKIKEKLEAACPNTVSCADIVVLAGRDSVHLSKGPYFQVPTGRKDSLNYFLGNSITAELLPGPTSTIDVLLKPFLQQSLSAIDLVALSGAHTVGTAHCNAFNGSLFPALAERLSQSFGQGLLQICLTPQSNSLTVNDRRTPFVFDNRYFTNLVAGQALFNSDSALLANAETKKAVEEFASDQEKFFEQFAESYIKMSMLNVKTGSGGNIRKVCSILNSNSVGGKNLTGSSFNMMYAATDTIYSST